MTRTTIMAPDELLDRLRAIARAEGRSLADVIREALELRARRTRPPLTFIAAGRSGRPGHRTAEASGEMRFEPRSWR